jgi:membrane protein YqaA with SNARE-associated domain
MWEILGGLLLGSLVSGIVPLVNAELLVVASAAALPPMGAPLVAVVSTLGQMVTKTSLFGLARWAPSWLPKKAHARLEGASRALAERDGAAGSVVLTSAITGLPPFYGVSLAAGALGMRLSRFVGFGSAGRLVRFGALAWAGSQFGAGALELIADASTLSATGG